MEHEEIPSLLSLDYHHHSFSSCITIYTIQQLTYWINYYKNNTSLSSCNYTTCLLSKGPPLHIHSSVKQPLQWDCLSFSIYTSFFSLLSLIQGREVRREREGDKGIHHKDHLHQKTSVVLVL